MGDQESTDGARPEAADETTGAAAEATPPAEEAAPREPLAEAQARIEALEAEKLELRDRVLRSAADFDNFKKRSRRDVQEAQDRGREALLRELLVVVDNLERALSHSESAEEAAASASALVEGVRLVLRQFLTVLEKFEVRPFSALGEAFDPELHAAIQQVETDDEPAGRVVAEYQKGYRIAKRLLRPATVAVAKPKAPAETSGGGDGSGGDGSGGEGGGSGDGSSGDGGADAKGG
jgi:molecular chaperone GrpE